MNVDLHPKQLTRVVVESPYAGNIELNTRYAQACMNDCIQRWEAPFASHLLYPQPGVLDENDPEQRELGIAAGLSWGGEAAELVAFYIDLGWSEGMKQALAYYKALDKRIVTRHILDEQLQKVLGQD